MGSINIAACFNELYEANSLYTIAMNEFDSVANIGDCSDTASQLYPDTILT